MQIDNVQLNFQDNYYMFYDWLKQDEIKRFDNVRIIKVISNTLNDFLSYKVKIDSSDFNNQIVIFSDEYSYVAISFDSTGQSIKKSSLSLYEEERLNKYLISLKESKIIYQKLSKDKEILDLRKNLLIKESLTKEFSKLIANKDLVKLNYLYYEWFQRKDNVLDMQKNIEERLMHPITSKELYLYNLIQKSYKLV